jgi:BirA family biotin operon repressor/biotin-[acetyl-CoA-carboxylase] ligase
LAVQLDFIPETGSTNADLVARLRAGSHVAEGYWLVADRQSAGRGRQGRSWLDAPGNFMGSTVVRIAAADPPPPSLSFVAALAVYEAIIGRIADPAKLQLKWPNDLLLDGAKLVGILLERAGDAAVIGIGVNLAWSPSLPDRDTGHLTTIGPAPDRDIFARDLAASFDRELERWRNFGLESLLARWLAAAHPAGAPLSVHDAEGARISGTFAGLEPDGALRLRLADGSMRVIHAGDVTLEGN